jgi:indolepyruvate ferredoxin oxidoreductase beta subunit
MTTAGQERPLTIAVLALGGQGGGVLTKWLVDTAEANDYLAQSTYVAGVAQRTGTTVYCIELFASNAAKKQGQEPVFTPYPVPGDVDLVITGEMAETGRAIQKGFVSPETTTLIASSHRVYSIIEKEALDDGILDQSPVADMAMKAAKKFICFDMDAAAEETGSVISSVMLGAIAATGVLPFERAAYEQTIRDTGRAVEQNLRGFAAGFAGASATAPAKKPEGVAIAQPAGPNGQSLASRIKGELPEPSQAIALHGALRALEYQDVAYANAYLDTMQNVYRDDAASGGDAEQFALTTEVARQLALQMCYEDTMRVADLKTRWDRTERVRAELAAEDSQPVHIVEYFHPRIEEICDTLPLSLGTYILNSPRLKKALSAVFAKGRNVTTSSITGFLMLRTVAKMRRWRRATYRFNVQQQRIADWLALLKAALANDYDRALLIARSMEMVKGYGDTYERGLARYKDAIQ